MSAPSQYFCMNPVQSRWMSNPYKTAPMKHYKHTWVGVFLLLWANEVIKRVLFKALVCSTLAAPARLKGIC